MSIELGRRLLASELVTRENVRDTLLLSELRGVSFPRALVERGIVTEAELDDEIARLAGPGLRYVQGSVELVTKLPRTMPRRLSALPTRTDPQTGIVDIAAVDPFDSHIEAEMSFHLKAPVRVLRASINAVEEAIRRIELATDGAPIDTTPRTRRLTPALPYGAPGSIPPPAPSTPIPLVVKRSPNSVSLDDADTYIDDLNPNDSEDLGRTAGWGTQRSGRIALPHVSDADGSESLGRTAGWGSPVTVRSEDPTDVDLDESASLGRTAGWGSPVAVRPAAPDEADVDVDESASLGRTAAWGSVAQHRPATPAPAQRLNRSAGFEEEPPRVSFPSNPPPGHESVAPPLGFAPPELSAWKGLANLPPPRDVVAASNRLSVNVSGIEDADIETTFVSEDDDFPPHSSEPISPIETISLNSIPEGAPASSSAEPEASFEDDFDETPQRPTLVDFPPQTSIVDAKAMIAVMAEVANRDEIVELAFRCMSQFAHRTALFSAKRDGFHGWLCNEAFGSLDALRKVVIPNNQPSIMATAAATSIYLGPIPRTAVHDSLLAAMGEASGDVAVASVRVGGKVAAMLVTDQLRDTLSGTRRMDELARAMGDALTRLVKTRG